ncbi:MAG: hypothetical protein WBG54_23005 [Acidobacteriaceae bacterium]
MRGNRLLVPLLCAAVGVVSSRGVAQLPAAPHAPATALSEAPQPILFPTTLDIFSSTPLSVPPFGYFGAAQCDASGRMYFAAGNPLAADVTYLSISSDGQQENVYSLPKAVLDAPHNVSFYAAGDGEMHFLVVQPGVSVTWLRFDKDGRLSGTEVLPVPTNIDVNSFAVTPEGYLLLLGYHPLTTAHGADDGSSYRAIFDINGKRIATLSQEKESSGTDPSNGPSQEAVTAWGGNFYWIDGQSIVVMDTTGNVVRSLPFSMPSKTARVLGLHLSGGLAEITFLDIKARPQTRYLIVNAATGDAYGIYLPPEGEPMNLVCYDAKEGFTFLGVMGGHLSLVQALAP